MKKVGVLLLSLIFFLMGCGGSDEPINDQFGRVWHEQEGDWAGTWTRRGNTNTFDAVYVNPVGLEIKDELTLESVADNEVVFYRKSQKGRYRGLLSSDGTKVDNGTADWFQGGVTWSATIEK